jgi:hypothetical protein
MTMATTPLKRPTLALLTRRSSASVVAALMAAAREAGVVQ